MGDGHNTENYQAQGGALWVVGPSGELEIKTGGKVTAAGTQALTIADAAGGATVDAEARTAVNAILAALKGVGIIASS